jgi:hypothetical protein
MIRLTDRSHVVAPAAKKRKIGPETFTGADMSTDIRTKGTVADPNTSHAEKGVVINEEEEEEGDGDGEGEGEEEDEEEEDDEEDEGVDDEPAVKTKVFRGRESKAAAAEAETDNFDDEE